MQRAGNKSDIDWLYIYNLNLLTYLLLYQNNAKTTDDNVMNT